MYDVGSLKYDTGIFIGGGVHDRAADGLCTLNFAVRWFSRLVSGSPGGQGTTVACCTSLANRSQESQPKHLGNRRRKNKHMTKHVRF